MGKEGKPALFAAMLAAPEPPTFNVDCHFAEYPDILLPLIRDAMAGHNATRRRNALLTLRAIAPEGKEMIPLLLPLLDSADESDAGLAAYALAPYGDLGPCRSAKALEARCRWRPAAFNSTQALSMIGIETDQVGQLWPGVLRINDSGSKEYEWFYSFGRAAASPGRRRGACADQGACASGSAHAACGGLCLPLSGADCGRGGRAAFPAAQNTRRCGLGNRQLGVRHRAPWRMISYRHSRRSDRSPRIP